MSVIGVYLSLYPFVHIIY